MKIRLVHILNNVNGEREIKSIENLSKLSNYNVEYIQQVTPLYKGKFPKSMCGLPHGEGHYGLFQSFKKALQENFTEDLDALILCECDCVLDIDYDDFIPEIKKTLEYCLKHDIYQFSWGGNILYNGAVQGQTFIYDDDYMDYFICNKIIMTHFTILTKSSREFFLRKLNELSWDTVDIWLNLAISSEFGTPGKQATVKKRLAYQTEGISLLDNFTKKQ